MMALAAFLGCLVTNATALADPPAGSRARTARSVEPLLLSGPSSGAPIRIESRFDGLQRKLAWSRFENGRWSEPHALTFGPGDDLAPAAGTSSTGSTLYWTDGKGRIFYVPFDPESGRLFAVPRPLPLTRLGRNGPTTEGGADAPIILGTCDQGSEPCVSPRPGPPTPTGELHGGIGLEGGTDVPIVLGTGTGTGTGGNSTTLGVASSSTCATQVLSVASRGVMTTVAVDGSGRVTLLGRFLLAPGVDPADATAAVGTYFHRRACE